MPKICPRCSELLPDGAGYCPFDGTELATSSDRFLGKTIAARYRLTKRLGSGGMSIVYLARHELISRLSAIKILRPELSQIPEHRERFLREARAVNRINHENIVEITDVGESDGVAYLVMEYVEGESLLAQIQRGPLRWDRAVRIAVQVSAALARAHQMGIIHRDLKPENILLVPHHAPRLGAEPRAPSRELVKLTDFGIAKMAGEPTLTWNAQLFGTPGYIAPEYVSGLPMDGRADIYSLSVVLYEMITGQLPFEGHGESDLLLKPLTTAPVPPSQRIQGLPAELEELLLRGLAREPADRPHDAFALHDALLDVLRGSGTAPPPGPSEKAPLPDSSARPPTPTVVDHPRASVAASQRRTVDLLRPWETIDRTRSDPSAPPSGGVRAERRGLEAVGNETSSRCAAALAELEVAITKARLAGGASALAAGRAAELALVAAEMMPRLERAERVVGDLQAKVDRLEAVGREFRASLGHAIDVLVHDRSRERAHLDALRARREVLAGAPGSAPSLCATSSLALEVSAPSEPRLWEVAAIVAEERRAEDVVEDLRFQIGALQEQLDTKNEQHELALVQATGTLEGSLLGLRRLRSEIARTIDDGLDLLQAHAGAHA